MQKGILICKTRLLLLARLRGVAASGGASSTTSSGGGGTRTGGRAEGGGAQAAWGSVGGGCNQASGTGAVRVSATRIHGVGVEQPDRGRREEPETRKRNEI
jgi:hypothetical protein